MKKRIEKNYCYTGLGFPIELHDVEMVIIDGEKHPKIDVRRVADKAIRDLVSQKNRLTGNQVKFIRKYFSMSLREFSKVVNESHMAIKKWEDFKDKVTHMDSNIEFVLRLNVFDKIVDALDNNKHKVNLFYSQYRSLINIFHIDLTIDRNSTSRLFCSEDKTTYKISSNKGLISKKKNSHSKVIRFKDGHKKSGKSVTHSE